MKRELWFAAIMTLNLGCVDKSSAQTSDATTREVSKRNLETVLKCLEPVISSGKAIRLYYRAACHPTTDFARDDPVPFPSTRVHPAPQGKTELDAVREIFKADENVTVTQEGDIIRISIGNVPRAILQTKLSRITLDAMAQHNPMDAIAAIGDTKEMASAMRSLGVEAVANLGGSVAEPDKILPHLPGSMANVTVEQVLDEIAKTWAGEGIVIYGACAEQTGPGGRKPFWLGYSGNVVPK